MQANIPKAVQFLFSLLWLWGSLASGQSFRTLYDFTTLPAAGTNLDGANPRSYLVQSGGVLYGMTFNGGATGYGSTFKVNTDGTGFTNLHSFTTSGGHPWSGLVLVGDRIYGTSRGSVGPTLGPGIVFALNTDGSGFTNLHVFNASSEGYSPTGGLIASGDTLFGTTSRGATAFKLQTDGGGFTTLSGGTYAYGKLMLSGDRLFGTVAEGGPAVLFAVNTDGTGYTNLYTFSTSNGINPYAGVTLAGDTLYGTALNGGASGKGTVYSVKTNGSGFNVLHHFTGGSESYPWGHLVLLGNTLYGTTAGFPEGYGTVYSINTDGTGYSILHSFSALKNATNWDGADLLTGLVLSSNALYGTTFMGGKYGSGTIFAFTLPPPQLSLTISENSAFLSWPTNIAGFHLQSCTNLDSSSPWEADYSGAGVVDGINTVTNTISESQKFYRLAQ